MRFKNGNKLDAMKGVQKLSRNFIVNHSMKMNPKFYEEQEDDYSPIYNTVSKNLKRSSPFCSSIHEPYQNPKKVKHESQRYISAHSYKKVDNVSRISSKPNDDECDSDDDECSVGSCSVVHSDDDDDDDNISSDDVAVSIHRLELHAYRSTLEALYASGPLSWEKEALLTNLRINLHISNDEHLIELRHLMN